MVSVVARTLFFVTLIASFISKADIEVTKAYRNGTKAVVTFDMESILEVGDMVRLTSGNNHCNTKVIDVKKGKALLSTRNCDFRITTKDIASFVSNNEEGSESYEDKTQDAEDGAAGEYPTGRGGGEKQSEKMWYFELGINLYGRGISDYKAQYEDFDIEVKDASTGGAEMFFTTWLTEKRYLGLNIGVGSQDKESTLTIIEGDNRSQIDKNMESIFWGVGILASPVVLSLPVRPVFQYGIGKVKTKTKFDNENHAEEKIKINVLSYGLRYDLNKKRKDSFLYATVDQIKIKYYDGTVDAKELSIGMRMEITNNSYFEIDFEKELEWRRDRALSFGYRYKYFKGAIAHRNWRLPAGQYEPNKASSFTIDLGVLFDFKM